RRWAELGTPVEPYLPGFYRPWYETPTEPAYAYNPRTPPVAPPPPGGLPGSAPAAHAPMPRTAATLSPMMPRSLRSGIGGRLSAAASSLTVISLPASLTGS